MQKTGCNLKKTFVQSYLVTCHEPFDTGLRAIAAEEDYPLNKAEHE